MITLRIPNGVSLSYEPATHTGQAQVIRLEQLPVEQGVVLQELTSHNAIQFLTKDETTIRTAPPFLVAKLKKLLGDFDAKTHQWRPQ